MKRTGIVSLSLPLLLTLFALLIFPVVSSEAAHVSPPMVFIEDKQRTAQLTINNRGKVPKIFRFSWEHRAMDSEGKAAKLKEGESFPGYRPLDPYIRFSPRQVTLKPGQHQKVSFLVQRPADMEEGEYHSHLLIQEEPLARKKTKEAEGGLGGQVAVIVNKSVPVFLRHGATKLDVSIEKAAFIQKEGKRFLSLDITNNSTRSVYAPLVLVCRSNDGKENAQPLMNLRLYSEARKQIMDFSLDEDRVNQCPSPKVRIEGGKDFEMHGQTLATAPISSR